MTRRSEKAIMVVLAVITLAAVAFIFIVPQIDLDPGVLRLEGTLFLALAMLLRTWMMQAASAGKQTISHAAVALRVISGHKSSSIMLC